MKGHREIHGKQNNKYTQKLCSYWESILYHGALKLGFFPGIHGYYWIFPKSDTSANVGVGLYIEEVRGGQNLKTLLNEVLLMENLQDLAVEKTISGILPARIVDKVVHDNILSYSIQIRLFCITIMVWKFD